MALNLAAAFSLLLLASSISLAQVPSEIEQLQNEQLRLLTNVRHEIRLAEVRLQRAPKEEPGLPQKRRDLSRLKQQFEAIERDIESEQRGEIVYISSSSSDPRISSYYFALKGRIEQVGTDQFPKINGNGARGTAAVLLELDRSGNVCRVEVVQSSTPELREHAQALLQGLSPFEPLPIEISPTAKRVVFVTSFVYGG